MSQYGGERHVVHGCGDPLFEQDDTRDTTHTPDPAHVTGHNGPDPNRDANNALMADALQCKEHGNGCLLDSDGEGALRFYGEGLVALRLLKLRAGDLSAVWLAATLHANSAQALMQEGRWKEAVFQCQDALSYDPEHAKAAWRGATAAAKAGMLHNAASFVENGLQHNPECVELLVLQARIGSPQDVEDAARAAQYISRFPLPREELGESHNLRVVLAQVCADQARKQPLAPHPTNHAYAPMALASCSAEPA